MRIKKRILSIVFSCVMILSLLVGVVPMEAQAASFYQPIIDKDSIQLYDSGCLKEITVTVQTSGSYGEAYGRIGVHKAETSYNWNHRFISSGCTTWPEEDEFITKDPTFLAFAKGEPFLWTDQQKHTVTVGFDDGEVNLSTTGTYYIYLWTISNQFGIYTDALIGTLGTENGVLKDSSGNTLIDSSATQPSGGNNGGNNDEEVTYNITLDRTNYIDGWVWMSTYNNEKSNVKDTEINNDTIVMPDGGYVRVFADSKFDVVAEGATISEMINSGEEGYYYEITNIKKDTTVVVNKKQDVQTHTHSLTKVPAKAATCTKEGNKEYYKCLGCDNLFTDDKGTTTTTVKEAEIKALGHDWSGKWIVTKEATETADGKKETLCTRDCGQKKVASIPIIGTKDDNGSLEKDAEVEKDSPVKEVTLNNSKKQLLEEGKIFTDTEKNQIANGADARVWIEISKTNESDIASTDKAKIEQEADKIMGDNSKVTYFDAELFKQIGNGDKQEITEPGVVMKITIKIPDSLLNKDKTLSREYKIIRLHEGKVDIIEGKFDLATGEFTFESDKFSTYAIIYKDVAVKNDNTDSDDDEKKNDNKNDDKTSDNKKKGTTVSDNTDAINPQNNDEEETPKTGDSNTALYSFMLMILSGLGIVSCSRKMKKN